MMNVNLFKKISLIAMLLALCVVVLGAYVRLSDAGLGCPDWPGCYGALTVPQSEAAIQKAQTIYPDKPIEAAKAWKEMVHRYLAGTLGLLILAMCVLAFKCKREIQVSTVLTTFLVLLVGFQAALGKWTVTMLLKPAIVTAHLIGGMSTLAILVWIAHRHWGNYSDRFLASHLNRRLIRFALMVLACQIVLGGWTSTNYAALACTDFPTCHGLWMPETDFKDAFHLVRRLGESAYGGQLNLVALSTIQWVHRVGALVTFVVLGVVAWRILRYAQLRLLGVVIFVVLAGQVALGILNLVLQLPTVLAVAHHFGAALLLGLLVVLNSKITGHS